MKKFSFLAVAAIIGMAVLSGTASAQYRVFGGRCGNSCQPSTTCQPNYSYQPSTTCQPSVTYYYPSSSCGNGFVVQPQQVIGQPKVIVAPDPNATPPYKGEEPKKITPVIDPKTEPTLPPKKIPAPNPRQDGPGGASINMIYINGMAYGQISDGSYANIANGDYQRLTTQYGNK